MIRLLNKFHDGTYIHVDGGYKSLGMADFISNEKEVELVFIVFTKDKVSVEALKIVNNFALERELPLKIIINDEGVNESNREFLTRKTLLGLGKRVARADSLTDAMVHHLVSSRVGTPKLMAYRIGYFVHPFLLNSNEEIKKYVKNKAIHYHETEEEIRNEELDNILIEQETAKDPLFKINFFMKMKEKNQYGGRRRH